MSRYRLIPTPAQQAILRVHCAHARFVWNLAVEQHQQWRRGRKRAPGYLEQCRQLTQVRAEYPWLGPGCDRAGRWHVAFAAVPAPVPAPGNGQRVGIDRGVAVAAALSTGELLHVPALTGPERARVRRLQRKLARARRGSERRSRVRPRSAKGTPENPGRNVRAKAGLNRRILRSGWGLLVRRLEDKAPGRAEKVSAAFTSQRCPACGQVDARSRESQARFVCTACGYAGHADVNAAISIAAGHPTHLPIPVHSRGGLRDAGPANREPHLLASFTGCE